MYICFFDNLLIYRVRTLAVEKKSPLTSIKIFSPISNAPDTNLVFKLILEIVSLAKSLISL